MSTTDEEGSVRIKWCSRPLLALLVLTISGFSCSAFTQITFERTYGDSLEESGHSVWQTSDGGYIIAGAAHSFSAGSSDVYLVRTDSLGDTLWTRTYRDSTSDEGWSVQQTLDGGYIVAGWTRDYGPAPVDWDAYLLKVDSDGLPVWDRTYGWDGYDVGSCVQQTLDGGYVVVGTAQPPHDFSEVYFVKTDANGNPIWENLYGSNVIDSGNYVEQTQDSGYIIVGSTGGVPLPLEYGVYLIRIGPSGFKEWERTYGDSGSTEGHSVQQTMDNGYIIVGCSEPPSHANTDAYLIKTDSLGNTLWERTYGGVEWDGGGCGLQTPDGGYVILGLTRSSGTGFSDLWFFKTDSLGNMLWSRTYGGPAGDFGVEVRQTSDGGYVLVGSTSSFGAGSRDVYLIKTDENGLVGAGRDVAVLSLDSPPDTVFVDSAYAVTATVRNFGSLTATFDVVAGIDSYADTVQVLDLEPGLSTQVGFKDWQVPSSDSTSYTMAVCTHVVDDIDTTNDCMQKTLFAYNPTGIEEGLNRPSALAFRLWQNEPNPFSRSTMIQYSLPAATEITLSVYDVAGGLVETLLDRRQGPGVFRVRWDGQGNADGIYFYRLEAGDFNATGKMILLR